MEINQPVNMPAEVFIYIEQFFRDNKLNGQITKISMYGGSVICQYSNSKKAKIEACMWQGQQVVLDQENQNK